MQDLYNCIIPSLLKKKSDIPVIRVGSIIITQTRI